MKNSGHVSWYVNVGQTLGIIGGLALGFRAIKLEEQKAGITKRPIGDVIRDDIQRVRNWYSDNFGNTKQYRHY